MKKTSLYLFLLPLLFLFNELQAQDTTSYINSGEIIEKAVALHDLGKYDEALSYYNLITPSDTNYLKSISESMLTLISKEDYASAINIGKVEVDQPSQYNAAIYDLLATALDYDNQEDESIQTFLEGLSKYPYNRQMIYNYGTTLKRNGLYEEAQVQFEKALSIEPFHGRSHLQLAELMVLQGFRTKALLSFFTYLSINPSDTEIIIRVEDLLIDAIEEEGSIKPYATNGFEDLDALIRSKIADNTAFKPSVDLNYRITRHAEVILERLEQSDYKDFWNEFYLPFYNELKDSKKLAAFLYTLVSGVDKPEIQNWIKKKEKDIATLITLVQETWGNYRFNNISDIFGTPEPLEFWYFDNGKLNAIGNSDDDANPQGEWVYFYTNGQINARGFYNNESSKIGFWTYYAADGSISSTENYDSNGLLDGLYKSYHTNGQIASLVPYTKNSATGTIKIFNSCGQIEEAYEINNNIVSGPGKYFFPDSTISIDYNMLNGNIEGVYKEFYDDGKLLTQANYSEGVLSGNYVTYFKNGQVSEEGMYKAGQFDGNWVGYFEDGTKRLDVTYDEGKQIGQSLFYHKEGPLSEIIQYNALGELHGDYRVNDKDGLVHYEYDYDSGRLISYRYYNKEAQVISSGESSDSLLLKAYSPKGFLLFESMYFNGYGNGTLKYYHPNGQLYYTVNVENDLWQGVYQEYDESGTLIIKSNYVDGVLNGWYKSFHPNGQVSSEGMSINGNTEQVWKYYHPDGTLSNKTFNSEGELNGYYQNYTASGNLFSKQKWNKGKLEMIIQYDSLKNILAKHNLPAGNGQLQLITNSGKVRSNISYVCGQPEGIIEDYYEDGSLNSRAVVTKTKYNGRIETFYPDGSIRTSGNYKDDLLDSTWLSYDDLGQLSTKGFYKEGLLNGLSTAYHPNGQIEFECDFVDGKKDGSCSYFSANGSLQVIKHYDKDLGILSYQYEQSDGSLIDPIPINLKGASEILAFFKNGKKSLEQGYKDGLLDGKTTYYFSNGKIAEETSYINGDTHGIMKEYYPNGNLEIEQNWSYDFIHGKSKFFYPNGQLRRITNYHFDEKHGKDIWYSDKGAILRTILYRNDEIY